MLKNLKSKLLLGVMVVAIMFVGAVALTQTASAAPQAIVTVADIQYAATVRQGSSGQAALIWQRFLNGYSITAQLVEDGAFGPLSAVQAKAWQASKGLVADGVLGPMSRAVAMAQVQSGSPSSAFPAGCTSTVGYSSVTGLACYAVNANTFAPAGCTSASGYSPATGGACYAVSSNNLPAGCSSTAGFSPTTGASCSGGVSSNNGPLAGGAGDATLTHYTTSEKSTIKEGESDVKVLGFRVEATDSDIALQNVKVSILNTDTTPASYRIDRYLDSVDVYMGSTKVGSANVADFTKASDNTYSKSIALSNAVVRNGDKDPFYVVFNAASTIDSDNNGASLTVTVDSYRFQDATGVIMSYDADASVTNAVTIDTVSDALSLLSSTNNPDSSTLTVLENDTTADVLALAFKLKAGSNSSDITLDTLPIIVTIAGAGASVTSSTNIIESVVVKIGSTTITADETELAISAGAGTATYTADFSNEGIVIAAGDYIEAKVYITFTEQSGNYADSLTKVTASITGTAIMAESDNDDTISPTTGTQTGAELTLSTSAVVLSNVSWVTASGATSGNLDFYFTVAANNGDYDLLLAALVANDTVTGTTVAAPVLTVVSGDTATVITGGFTIPDGSTTNFRLRYAMTTPGGVEVKITSAAGQEVPTTKQISPTLYLQ